MKHQEKSCKAVELFMMSLGVSLIATGLTALYRQVHGPRMPKPEYQKRIGRMAAIDDRICRNRLEGNTFEGKPIVFPPREESIKYRYRLFYSMYRKCTREQLDAEFEKLKESLEESKAYVDEESVDLTLA